MTPVTLVPSTALISVLPEPVPELVIVPILLSAVVDRVMPFAMLLLLFRMRLPVVFATPPDNVSKALPLLLLFFSVVAVALVVSKPLIVSADVALFSVMLVMLAPTGALMVDAAVPVPEFVIVPVLFTAVVDKVIVPVLVVFKLKLPVPVTPPLNMRLLATGDKLRLWLSVSAPLKVLLAPLSVIVAVPVLPETTEIALVKIPANPPLNVALAEPLVLPMVMVPVPKALALTVPLSVPA